MERIKADPALGIDLAKGTIEDFIKAVQNVKVDLRPRQAFWQLVQGGVFDRHPQIKVVFSEVRSDWLPETLAYLDERFEKERHLTKLKPSEYFERHCYIAPSSPRPAEMKQRREIGIDRMLLGVDYPHVEGTWPNTWDWLRSIFTDFSEEKRANSPA